MIFIYMHVFVCLSVMSLYLNIDTFDILFCY